MKLTEIKLVTVVVSRNFEETDFTAPERIGRKGIYGLRLTETELKDGRERCSRVSLLSRLGK